MPELGSAVLVFFITSSFFPSCRPGADDPHKTATPLREAHEQEPAKNRATDNNLADLIGRVVLIVKDLGQRIDEDRGTLVKANLGLAKFWTRLSPGPTRISMPLSAVISKQSVSFNPQGEPA